MPAKKVYINSPDPDDIQYKFEQITGIKADFQKTQDLRSFPIPFELE